MLSSIRGLLFEFKRVLFESSLVGTRFTLVIAEFIWAISLLWEGDTFARQTYQGMASIATETNWAILFLVMGILQLFFLVKRDFHTKSSVLFSMINASVWLYVCTSMYMSIYPPPAAISGELALAIVASWVFIRTGWGSSGDEVRKVIER